MTQASSKTSDGELLLRATEAYFSECLRSGVYYQQPANYSRVRTYDGLRYVVLENVHGPLAVFGVGEEGHLDDVDASQWPTELSEEFGPEDILEAWASGDGNLPAIVISRVDGSNVMDDAGSDDTGGGPGLVWTRYGDDSGPNGFRPAAADTLLAESGYRRVGPWNRGMGPRTDRQGLGNGYSCEVEKVTEDALSAL